MDITLRRATAQDAEFLTDLRIEVLKAANKLPDDTELPEVYKNTAKYYARRLDSRTHIEYLAYVGRGDWGWALAGCGAASVYQVMPTVDNPSGLTAYIMNMYTRPGFRRRGVARRILTQLIEETEAMGITHIRLEATVDGRPLYESVGFAGMPNELRYSPKNENEVES